MVVAMAVSTVRRLALCMTTLVVLSERGAAQAPRTLYRTNPESLFAAAPTVRLALQRGLLAADASIRHVATCDCLVLAEPMQVEALGTVEIRANILRPNGGRLSVVVLDILVGSPQAPTSPARPAGLGPPAVKTLAETVLIRVRLARQAPEP